MRLHIIGRSKAFDLFPRTHKGKNRCVLRKKHALINSREPLLKSDINLEQSSHVETCCLLVAENGQKALRVPYEVPAGLPSGTTVEPRADSDTSYRRIKEIVKQNTGLSVSSLYIAQVKEAYGIKERDCYNRGNGSGRVPQCPEAKRAAIEDALREVGLLPVENEN